MKTLVRDDIEVEREARSCGVVHRRAHATVIWFYIVAALFNGEALLREAELMPYGYGRDIAVAAARPLAAVAKLTGVGRLRAWSERLSPSK